MRYALSFFNTRTNLFIIFIFMTYNFQSPGSGQGPNSPAAAAAIPDAGGHTLGGARRPPTGKLCFVYLIADVRINHKPSTQRR